MKLHHLALIVFIAGLFGCQNNQQEIIISGQIKGDIPDKIEYTDPINGTCNWWFTKTVIPDSLGKFKINIESSEALFLKLRTSFKKQGTLIIEPGQTYDLTLDLTKEKNILSINNNTSIIHETYGEFPNPFHIQDGAREFLRDSLAKRIYKTIEQRKKDEIAQFEKLISEDLISKEVFDLVKTDRECYYHAISATTAWIKRMMAMRSEENTFDADFDQLWKDAFQSNLLNTSEIIHSQWFNFYAEAYINFQEYENGNFTNEKLEELRNTENIKTIQFKQAKEYLPAEICENYLANYIYQESAQKKYEKELIDLFSDFNSNYPNSEYNIYISPLIEEIAKFHEAANADFNENIHFVDDYKNSNSLAELAATFSEEFIYIDVWATWCGPCKAEFEHKTALIKLLKKYNIPVMYISIDREQDAERWKNMIKFYNLEGYHVLANKTLDKELRKIFDRNGSLSIPWYILIKADGSIVKKHASRPSKLEALEKEINETSIACPDLSGIPAITIEVPRS